MNKSSYRLSLSYQIFTMNQKDLGAVLEMYVFYKYLQ